VFVQSILGFVAKFKLQSLWALKEKGTSQTVPEVKVYDTETGAMTGQFLIYGATGYTGKLMAQQAKSQGLNPILGGRTAKTLQAVADPLGFDYRVADLSDQAMMDRMLDEMTCVLHGAGPFSATSEPMLNACIRKGVHYLDITGEIEVFEACARRDLDAKKRGIMVMPGVGFDVVPSDCLAAYVKECLPDATQLLIGISGLHGVSRGTAKTMVEGLGRGLLVRRQGNIVALGQTLFKEIDFGNGPQNCVSMKWGDVATAYYTTGIPNITVFFEVIPQLKPFINLSGFMRWLVALERSQAFLKWVMDRQPVGPTDEARQAGSTCIYAEAENEKGDRVRARLRTPEGYTLTAMTGIEVAKQVLAGDVTPGYQTPAKHFGSDFILRFEGCTREDVA
jgi:short subunit dehydrogenase-like uncharacterized protein